MRNIVYTNQYHCHPGNSVDKLQYFKSNYHRHASRLKKTKPNNNKCNIIVKCLSWNIINWTALFVSNVRRTLKSEMKPEILCNSRVFIGLSAYPSHLFQCLFYSTRRFLFTSYFIKSSLWDCIEFRFCSTFGFENTEQTSG